MNSENLNKIERTEQLRSGKANDVYLTSHPEYLELEATDRISAGNGEKKDIIPGKGKANNAASKKIFAWLEKCGVPTHYVGPGSTDASKIVKKAEPILLEVIGRFKATGGYVNRYKVQNMMQFDGAYIEYTYKCDASGDPPICEAAIIANGLLTRRELGYVEYITERVAYIVKEFFDKLNIELIDFKIEFGRLPNGQIVVIDEISPDTCRLLDKETGESLDKDRFRKDLGKVAESYAEILRRVEAIRD